MTGAMRNRQGDLSGRGPLLRLSLDDFEREVVPSLSPKAVDNIAHIELKTEAMDRAVEANCAPEYTPTAS